MQINKEKKPDDDTKIAGKAKLEAKREANEVSLEKKVNIRLKEEREVSVRVKKEAKREPAGESTHPSSNRISPKNAYVLIMNEYVPDVDVAFNFASQVRCTSIAFFQKLSRDMEHGSVRIENFSEIIRSLLFVRKIEDTLEQTWTSTEGLLASKCVVGLCFATLLWQNVTYSVTSPK